MKRRIYRNGVRLLRRNFSALFAFEIIYKTAATAVFYPLFMFGFQFALNRVGFFYITADEFLSFMRRPLPAVIFILVLLLAALFTLYEYTSLIFCFEMSRQNIKISFREMFLGGFRHIGRVFRPYTLVLSASVVLGNLVLGLPVIFILLSSSEIVMQIRNFFELHPGLFPWILAGFIPVFLLLLCLMFMLPFLIIEKKGFFASVRASFDLIRGKVLTFFRIYFLGYLWLIFAVLGVYTGVIFLCGAVVRETVVRDAQITTFLTSIGFMNPIIAFLFTCVFTPMVFALLLSIFYRFRNEAEEARASEGRTIPRADRVEAFAPIRLEKKGVRRFFSLLLLSAMGLNLFLWLSPLRTGLSSRIEFLRTTEVSAHRGSELRAPENTIAAMQAAYEDMADYVEIDIQLTRDEVPVLLHDNTLLRTAGVVKRAPDMTYIELSRLDAGSWFSGEFLGEKIPTLDEAFQFASGKMKLNIEIKTQDRPEITAKRVAELIEKYDFYEYCVVTSFFPQSLLEIKQIDERIQTGLILTLAFGNYTSLRYIDFFSLYSQFVTPGQVAQLHRKGFAVHVWAADSPKTIRRLLDCGVDNLITADPLTAKEIVLAYRANPGILRVVELIFGQEQLAAYAIAETERT